MKRVLINVSNHSSKRWSEEQKKYWTEIVDIPFPQVDPYLDEKSEEWEKLVENISNQIETTAHSKLETKKEPCFVALMLQGEFSLCYAVLNRINKGIILAIPTTKREVVEIIDEEGDVKKESKFSFVRWRFVAMDD